MTGLILSLWAFGILLLIAFAVYRGKNSSAASSGPLPMMNAKEVAEFANRARIAATARQSHKAARDSNNGNWKAARDLSPGLHPGKLVASSGKPMKPGLKGVHAHFVKPGKPAR